MTKYYFVRTEEGADILVECADGFDLGEQCAERWVRNHFHTYGVRELTKEYVDNNRFDDIWKVENRQQYDILTGNYSWW